MKVVLDSNILLIAIGRRSIYRPIWMAFIEDKIKLVVSEEILYEYEEIMQEHSAPGVSDVVMNIFSESLQVVHQQIYYSWNLIKQDPDDNKFFDIAIASNADYLVTNDAHFNIVKDLAFPYVKIISAEELLNTIQNL